MTQKSSKLSDASYADDACAQASTQLLLSLSDPLELTGFPPNFTIETTASLDELLVRIPADRGLAILCKVTPADYLRLIDMIKQCWRKNPYVKWVALLKSGHTSMLPHMADFGYYFYDYHHEPLDWPHIKDTLGHAHGMSQLAFDQGDAPQKSSKLVPPNNEHFQRQLEKLIPIDDVVLFSGKTGTGKSHSAHQLHLLQGKNTSSFIEVNCGALTETLIQSELFGHEKGAFTGATKTHIGFIERAQGGTLFLDEISELPKHLQALLLQFLDRRSIVRVGGEKSIKINTQIMAATNVNLSQAVKKGHFREDLYYRLSIYKVECQSLAENPEMIPKWANYFMATSGAAPDQSISQNCLLWMQNYHWPGNLREMHNRIKRALVFCETGVIEVENLGVTEATLPPKKTLQQLSKTELKSVITQHQNNLSAVAKALAVSRNTLYRWLKKHELH
ncbi:sigma-54-dependent transcriptional regulator [Paraferrimonas sedimenticola]|uniref:Sigma-54-dependent Fis family transcriptional regulator n=1 Tax=Paraferrimonas sedimenticola TaxID=375674 RepID=A0AA37RYA1_9GAMM|nr:sigma-54 dependent transcriptional regulator [Paraferrimonas sedimenticola]GLP96992.1 sigma-54-dependent Fis family transcriptional regulator [Paraferrimonas sedimenticola]